MQARNFTFLKAAGTVFPCGAVTRNYQNASTFPAPDSVKFQHRWIMQSINLRGVH